MGFESITRASVREAKKARAALLVEASKGRHEGTNASLDDLFGDWVVELKRKLKKLGYYRKDGKPTTELGHVRCMVRVVRRLYGRSWADDFGPLALKACREEFLKAGQKRLTVNQNVGRIKRMMRWAVEHELVGAVRPEHDVVEIDVGRKTHRRETEAQQIERDRARDHGGVGGERRQEQGRE